jgi:hypothetical protein
LRDVGGLASGFVRLALFVKPWNKAGPIHLFHLHCPQQLWKNAAAALQTVSGEAPIVSSIFFTNPNGKGVTL